MVRLRPRVTDDRGKVLPLAPILTLQRPGHGGLGFWERRWIESAMPPPAAPLVRRAVLRGMVPVLPVMALQALLLPVLSSRVAGRGPAGVMLVLVVGAALGAALPAALIWAVRSGIAREVAAAYARAGHCGSCTYPLGDHAEEDGCRVCPECGGAWKAAGSGA